MPEFRGEEKRVGLHSAVFRQLTLQAIHLRLGIRGKRPRSAKVRLAEAQNHTEERLNGLITLINELLRRLPPPDAP
jgi:hypothetical protein